MTEINPFLVTATVPARFQCYSLSPNNYLRLRMPVNSHTILNVYIALWCGCKNNPHLHFPIHSFQSANKGLWHLKALLLYVNILHHIKHFILNSKCQCTTLNKLIIMKHVSVQNLTRQCQWVMGYFLIFPTSAHPFSRMIQCRSKSNSSVLSYNDYCAIPKKKTNKETKTSNWHEKVPKRTKTNRHEQRSESTK